MFLLEKVDMRKAYLFASFSMSLKNGSILSIEEKSDFECLMIKIEKLQKQKSYNNKLRMDSNEPSFYRMMFKSTFERLRLDIRSGEYRVSLCEILFLGDKVLFIEFP